jgi:hypothetical protein
MKKRITTDHWMTTSGTFTREFIQTFRKCKWFGSFEMENIFIPITDKSRPEITPQHLITRYKMPSIKQ